MSPAVPSTSAGTGPEGRAWYGTPSYRGVYRTVPVPTKPYRYEPGT